MHLKLPEKPAVPHLSYGDGEIYYPDEDTLKITAGGIEIFTLVDGTIHGRWYRFRQWIAVHLLRIRAW